MWSSQSFQKHLCVLFLTSAVITSLIVLKNQTKASPLTNTRRNNIPEILLTENRSKSFTLTDNGQNANEIIHILGLFELTTKWGKRPEAASEIAAAQLAIQHVNHLNILPDYTLKLLINDTKCDPGVGIDTFFHAIYSDKNIIMLLGTSCSNVTESLAHIVPYWNILQISFGSTSPSLSDRKKFPLFFRTVAPDSSHNQAKLAFVKHFKWKVVATFCQSENKFLLPLNSLISEFENENISCVASITFSLDNYKEQLKVLKNSDIRIIIGSFSTELARKIFCEIYHLNMYGIDYVWILQDRREKWWEQSDDCTVSQLKQSVDGLILVADFNVVTGNNTSISGLNDELFERELNSDKQEVSIYARLAYDAIWVMALTLKDLHKTYLKEFNYKRNDIVCEFLHRMSSLNFMGISGPLKFIGADRIGSSVLRQLQGDNIRDIATYDSNTNQLDFFCKTCQRINWFNQHTPIAQRILKISLVTIPESLFYSIIFVALLGIAFSIFFLYFNLHFRRMKTVKISSPKLNNVAVIGCILVYLFVILLGFDTSKMDTYFDELCTVSVYLLSAGFSLAFGSMFAKTYRIHRIFAYYGGTGKVKDKLLKDKQLIVLILIPLLIDAIILGLWIMIDPMERQLYNLTLQINSEDRGVVYQPQVEVCRSQNTSGWLIAIYGYKGIILIMGVFMAWETRHVKVQALNDSQYIGICVYGAVFSAIITVLSTFITEYVVFSYLARTISILTSTTITLFLLFLPKLKSVFCNQQCQQDPIMQSMGLKIEYNTRRFINSDPKEQILRLEIQNKVYKCELEALDLEINRLENLTLQLDKAGSDSRKISGDDSSSVYTIYKNNDYDLGTKLGWASASWPEPLLNKSRGEFLSENKLDNNREFFFEKLTVLGKMKWLLDNFRRSSNVNPSMDEHEKFTIRQNHKSNPDIVFGSITCHNNLTKAKSEVFSSKNSIS